MSERKKIEEKLRKKEHEIAALEEKVKSAKIYVQALRDILRMLGSDGEKAVEVESILRPGSAVDQARRAILTQNEPMHIDDLLSALGKDTTRETKASLTSSLAAYVRRDEIFTRPAPNTFGLIELGQIGALAKNGEPPSDFGKDATSDKSEDDDLDIPF